MTKRTETVAAALPELDIVRVQRWCDARVPDHARHQVRVECQVAARDLTILEEIHRHVSAMTPEAGHFGQAEDPSALS